MRALESFLADIYADARVISDGVIPSQLVTSSTHFHRAVWRIKLPMGYVFIAGVDLIRNPGRRRARGRQRPCRAGSRT